MLNNSSDVLDEEKQGILSQLGGMALALVAAALVAISMIIQRYALTHHTSTVPFLTLQLSPNMAWAGGIFVYSVGNAVYSAALLFGPLSLLGSVFTTLLAFNLIFAKFILKESVTKNKAYGAGVIIAGAILSLIGAPNETDTKYTPDEMLQLIGTGGGAYFVGMVITLFFSGCLIVQYERKLASSHMSTPPRLHAFMGLVYPSALGLDEGITHLSMRAAISMFAECGLSCDHWTFYIALLLWLLAGLSTLPWLHLVFKRYETTLALPIEYGAVQVCAVCSGLIFFDEAESMTGWQLALCILGAFVILIGIAIGRHQDEPDADESQRKPPLHQDLSVDVAEGKGLSFKGNDSSFRNDLSPRRLADYSPLKNERRPPARAETVGVRNAASCLTTVPSVEEMSTASSVKIRDLSMEELSA